MDRLVHEMTVAIVRKVVMSPVQLARMPRASAVGDAGSGVRMTRLWSGSPSMAVTT
jgi:hypothetical protein